MRFRASHLLLPLVVLAGLSVLETRRSGGEAIEMIRTLDGYRSADIAVDKAALELLSNQSISFDGVQSALRDAVAALEQLRERSESRPRMADDLTEPLEALVTSTRDKEQIVADLTSRTSRNRILESTVARLGAEAARHGCLESSGGVDLSTFVEAGEAPSLADPGGARSCEDRLVELRGHHEQLRAGRAAAAAEVARLRSVPTGELVEELRVLCAVAQERDTARRQWFGLAMFAMAVLLAETVRSLVGRLQAKSEELAAGKEHLEKLVLARTEELELANETLRNDITRREIAESERDSMEGQLRQAQKLEAVGQLAAGVAHEINTPAQYVRDNTQFLKDVFQELMDCVREIRTAAAEPGSDDDEALPARIRETCEAADIDQLESEVPQAIDDSLDGIGRISEIVHSLKQFSHPSTEKDVANLNDVVRSTVTVARNEWKYVAALEMKLDPDLPPVSCVRGEISQVLLNLIVNASHAIAGQVEEGTLGRIDIETSQEDDWVVIRVRDTGGGVPDEIRQRIFDPFFTTKEVGMGTGQGLSIAHRVVVEGHHGSLKLETEPGVGSTFIVRLPLTAVAVGVTES